MRIAVRSCIAVSSISLLAACSIGADQRLGALDASAIGGESFSGNLAGEYQSLAQAEYAEFDFTDSAFFAERGIAAAGGSAPAPQPVDARALPEGSAGELRDARNRLTAALDAGAADQAAVPAAQAQAAYECWLQEQEENIQPDDIAACREGFTSAMALVDEAMAPAAAAEDLGATQALANTNYVVYFSFDGDQLSGDAAAVIDGMIADANNASKVNVFGHADAVGTSDYNMGLSERRAEAVANALVAGGVDASKINVGALGESLLAIATDGQEQGNRRVVVNLEP